MVRSRAAAVTTAAWGSSKAQARLQFHTTAASCCGSNTAAPAHLHARCAHRLKQLHCLVRLLRLGGLQGHKQSGQSGAAHGWR